MGDYTVVANPWNGDHVAITIGDPKRVLSSIKQKLNALSPSAVGKSCCIYRVHEKFRKINEYAYTPEIVSIGPFHHGKLGLLAMEDHKLRYMNVLLERTSKHEAKLKECVDSVSILEEEARKCYSEPIAFDSEKFVEMMVVDGLFIIELFGKSAGVLKTERDDTIFNNIWCMPSLVRDMILLENQLPMFVVERLFEIVKNDQPKRLIDERSLGEWSLNELALRFFDPLMKREDDVIKKQCKKKGKHFLDLLSKTFRDIPKGGTEKHSLKLIPSVTELRQAGVKFKIGNKKGSFLDIKFVDGIMTIPPILVQDQTGTLFRNFIASEQCCDRKTTYMTSYAFFMDSLIDSANDVAFLRRRQIITNCLGHDEDVSSLFNKLCSEVTLVNLYYSKLCEDVNKYYSERRHFWQATLRRDYFHNPWAIISFSGAILLLLLTLIATIFAVLAYFDPKSKS
ncbi:hypothetical protein ACHQM5_016309 [Ranunculus cassubicifolius]